MPKMRIGGKVTYLPEALYQMAKANKGNGNTTVLQPASELDTAFTRDVQPAEMEDFRWRVNRWNYDHGGNTYHNNCQRCCIATEMQFRGYDVEALAYDSTDGFDQGTKWKWVSSNGSRFGYWDEDINPNGYIASFKGAKLVQMGKRRNSQLANIVNQMEQWGAGSRAILKFTYNGRNWGHVINVVNTPNGVVMVDGQNGHYVDWDRQYANSIKPSETYLVRVDNLEIDVDKAKQAVQQRKKRSST